MWRIAVNRGPVFFWHFSTFPFFSLRLFWLSLRRCASQKSKMTPKKRRGFTFTFFGRNLVLSQQTMMRWCEESLNKVIRTYTSWGEDDRDCSKEVGTAHLPFSWLQRTMFNEWFAELSKASFPKEGLGFPERERGDAQWLLNVFLVEICVMKICSR